MDGRLTVLLASLAVACQGEPSARREHAQELREQRAEAIETRLAPSLVIQGEPVQTATLAERMKHHNVPGVSIAVINDGVVEWARGYGMADVEEGRPVTARTLFQAASISKPVAAAAALRFVEDGRLDLDRDVNGYLTSWQVPENDHTEAEPVTLRKLLTHTGGLTVSGFPGYARDEDVPGTISVLTGEGNTDPVRVDIDPGSQWRYSGGGYTVMQLLLTDVAGEPFPQILRETVLEPFGMTESTFEQPLPESRWEEAATGYRGDGSEVEGKWHVYPEMAPAGLWTTPSDIARFAIQIQKARAGGPDAVLSKAMADQMLTPTMNSWGLGLVIMGNGDRFGHGGSNEGFRCQFTAFIDQGRGAVVMTNSDSGGVLASEIMYNIGRAYGWPGVEPTEKVVVDVDPEILASYAGHYEVPGFGPVTIEAAEDRLWADLPGEGRVALLPEAETVFFRRENGQQVTFLRENGRVTGFEVDGLRAEKVE